MKMGVVVFSWDHTWVNMGIYRGDVIDDQRLTLVPINLGSIHILIEIGILV